MYLQVVQIKLPSEGESDPVKEVVFYKKSKGNETNLPKPYKFGEVLAKKVL